MAKIGLTKLITVKKPVTKTFLFNEQEIEVKQYLPLKEKLSLIQEIGISAISEKWVNPVSLDVLFNIKVIQYYTNINLTETQLANPEELFDTLELNGIVDFAQQHIPESEIETIRFWLKETVSAINTYNNSALGVMDNMSKNYDATKLDLEELNDQLRTPEMQEFVKNLPNMG